MQFRPVLVSIALLLGAAAAQADPLTGTFAVTVHEGLTGGNAFDTANGNPFTGFNTASATFTYTGPLSFSNTAPQNSGPSGDKNSDFFASGSITNYNGSGSVNTYLSTTPILTTVANYSSLTSFLNSSGSAGGGISGPEKWGSYYTFDLGNLAAGTILSITHDDGISLFQGSTRVGSSTSGATTVTTDTITVTNAGDTILRYARENGTPSVLQVSATAATPEPSSLALLGTGLLGLAGAVRRRLA